MSENSEAIKLDQQSATSSKIEYVEPEDGLFVTYANNIVYGFTPTDVRLIFGEVVDFNKGAATVEQRAHVTIAWMQAKVLREVLAALVAQHEKVFGEIRVPPEMLDVTPSS